MENIQDVIIKLKGGMGNQMFQYAFAKALERSAKNVGQTLNILFDTTAYTNPIKKDTRRPYMLPLLNSKAQVADDKIALQARNPYGLISKIIRKTRHKLRLEDVVAFDPALFQPPYQNYYEGYWQSEKYFEPVIQEIRQEFTLRKPLGLVAKSMLELITGDENAVSIFYRRTDYVGHNVFDISKQGYEERAIAHMRTLVPNLRLYVMSDDIDWVKENVTLPQGSVFVSTTEIPPEEEMVLASACKHNIIPNSTFAWWGAWLNKNPDKIVIAPKDWVQGDTSEYEDITPPNWLRV